MLIQEEPKKEKLKALFHGDAGSGKSTLASQAEDPLFLDADNGLKTIKVPFVDLVDASFDQNLEVFRELAKSEEHKKRFQTIVYDSIDRLEDAIHLKVLERYSGKYSHISQIPYAAGYKDAMEYWMIFKKIINHLCKMYHVILICHSMRTKIEDPLYSGAYDYWCLNLHQKASDLLHEQMDLVGFCCVSTYFQNEDAGFGKVRKVAVGGTERILIVGGNSAVLAKNRFNIQDPISPMKWDLLMNTIKDRSGYVFV